MKIVKTALRFRISVYVLLVIIVIMGVIAYRDMPLEAAPDIEIPVVLVTTAYPGVAPADMETLVTNVLERELKNLRDVKKITSTSAESVSVINIEFETGVDMDDAYPKVRDKVDQAKVDLPAEAEDPVITEINISEFPIMLVNIFGQQDQVRLKKIADDLEEQIESIPGVLNVDVTGGREREIQVVLNPERMEFYQLGVGQVINRIREEHLNMPGGNLELGNSKYLVRVPGEYKDVAQMEDIVLKAPSGYPVKLADVGEVKDGFKDQTTISRVNGQPCVTLRIQKRSGENIVDMADEVRATLAREQKNLPAGVQYLVRQDQSENIRDTVKDLENSVFSGLVLVLVVLLFFMGIRNAFFVAIAIPLSMLITVTVLSMMGVTLNMVVLFSLILALGMLVDNSIVVVENIFRHASDGASRFKAAYEGTKEVAWPIIASTATTVVAFGPLLFWEGIMGEFMVFLPMTVIIALLASLFVALVINPVLAATFLRRGQTLFDDQGEVKGRLITLYKKMLDFGLDHPWISLSGAVLTFFLSIALLVVAGAGVEFFPNTTPERAQIIIDAPQGTLLQTTDDLVKRVEEIADKEDNIKDVITNVGFGADALFSSGGEGDSHMAVIDIEFKDRFERTHSTWDTMDSVRAEMKKLSGAEYRLKQEEMGPPAGDPVAVQLSGPDYAVLYELSQKVKELIAQVDGVIEIRDDYDPGKPEIRVDVDREKAMLRKVNTYSIAQALRTAVNGTKASVLREGEDEYDITVRYDLKFRSSIQDLANIKVTGEDDLQIPLGDVARIETVGGLGSIVHRDQHRTVQVSSDVTGRSSSEVLIDVQALLKEELKLPAGYSMYFAGESEEQDKASAFLVQAFSFGILLMALILISQFNSVIRPGIILASILMSLVGVFIGLVITQNKFGIMMTGMGVISLAGVVVNNAIVLIDYINQLREHYGMALKEAVAKAGLVRFRPVIMTAITTILGLTPMALGVSFDVATLSIDVGATTSEWWGPMAQAVIFGLLMATVMTLGLVPIMYLLQVRTTDRIFGKSFARFKENAGNIKDATGE